MDVQWPLAIFSLLAGCGGGLLVFLAYGEVKGTGRTARFKLAVIALCAIIIGGCASVFHLGNPANIMAAAANIGSLSGISVELIFLGASAIMTVVYMMAVKRGASQSALTAFAVIAGILGAILAFVTGNGYVMESQAHWNTPLLPLCYLFSGLVMGGAVYLAVLEADAGSKAADDTDKQPDDAANASEASAVTITDGSDPSSATEKPSAPRTSASSQLNAIVLALAIIEGVAFIAYDAAAGFVGDALAFWVCAVVIGACGTAVCMVMARRQSKALYAGAACAIVGGVGIRVAMWIMGTGFLGLFTVTAARGVFGV